MLCKFDWGMLIQSALRRKREGETMDSVSTQRPEPFPPLSEATRIGVIVPAATLLDREYWALAGGNAEIYVARTRHIEGGMIAGRSLGLGEPELVEPAVRQLMAVRPHVVAFACTAASFIGGPGREEKLRETITRAGAPLAVTTSGALVEGLRRLGVANIAVATPYTEDLTSSLQDFLSQTGFGIVSTHALGLVDAAEVADLDQLTVEEMARKADHPEAEAIFLSCTNLPTVSVLGALSHAVGKPVLSSNLVTMASALSAVGETERGDQLLSLGV
jgi:maleate cis-trans isomerase